MTSAASGRRAEGTRRRPGCALALAALAALVGCGGEPPLGGTALVPRGGLWRLAPAPPAEGVDWTAVDFDDAAWSERRAPFGRADDDVATEIPLPPGGEDAPATFLRRTFTVDEPTHFDGLVVELRRDDGAAVYLNGGLVLRSNLPGGEPGARTEAPRGIGGDDEERWLRLELPAALLRAGRNTVAASVHNVSPRGKDLFFDLALAGYGRGDPVRVVRGPYLQRPTPDGVTIRWATNRAVPGRVRWGERPEILDHAAAAESAGQEHTAVLAGLPAGTRYAYAVGTTGVDVLGGDRHSYFTTAPPPGAAAATRLWVIGDPGAANDHARAVRDAFVRFTGRRGADAILTTGDNAYPSGTPIDYEDGFFDVYAALLRGVPVWPSIGNHDLDARAPRVGSPIYFERFTLPAAGESGGVASGSEAYYAFDHGNLHVVVLDSDGSDRSPDGPMLRWLRRDLAARRGDWLLAVFHHSPFSAGTHHDDREDRVAEMRLHALPLLEDAGADLVLTGHDHGYERSHLLRGPHPGRWAADPGRVADARLGRRDEGGPYRKGAGGTEGTVYAVVGSSGHTGPGPYDHPSMAVGLAEHGSLVIDVDGCELDAVFVDEEGGVRDRFAISKGAPCPRGVEGPVVERPDPGGP